MRLRMLLAATLLVGTRCTSQGQFPPPTITSISPSQTTAGAQTFTLRVFGSNFISDSVSRVRWRSEAGGGYLPTTFISSTQLSATVSSNLVASQGSAIVDVVNGGQLSSQGFTFIINPPPVIITEELNEMTVGVSFNQGLSAAQGTPPYSNWRIVEGALPLGLTLTFNGVITGTPATASSGFVQVYVDDSAGVTASAVFFWTAAQAMLVIATPSPLPNAIVGATYSQALMVNGGISPYSWYIVSGALPPGLTLSTAGVLSGGPTQGGVFNFTIGVSDGSKASTSKAFSLTVVVPPAPTLSVTGLSDTVNPAQQPSFDVQLTSAYSLPITGTVTLTFTPDAVNSSNDPAIQFSTGGRTLDFVIASGQMRAFPTSPPSIQTGTVAGRIDLTLMFSAGGQNITPTPAPVRTVTIARSVPTITSVQVVRTTGGFNVLVRGYSTPRQVTQAAFTLTASAGGNLGTTQITVPVDTAFTTWYVGTTSTQFGSSFLYTQPFTVQGNVSDIASVSVTLTNATGASSPVSASF